jgi:hypothetical protein
MSCFILFISYLPNYKCIPLNLNWAKSYEDFCSCPFCPIVLRYSTPLFTNVRNTQAKIQIIKLNYI